MFETVGVRDAVAILATAVADAPPEASSAEWVGLVGDCQQLVNTLSGVQTVALARLAALEEVQAEDGTIAEQDCGLGHQRLDAPALVGDLLGLTDAGAAARVEHAVRTACRIPELVGAMRAGVLDSYRAAVVSEELADADAEVCAAVMKVVGAHLGSEPAGALRRRVRRGLAQVAPDVVRVKASRARSDRALRRWTHRAGVDEWSGTFPVEQARPAWAVIDKLAKSYVGEGRSQNLDQARADALMDLVHGRASGTYLLQVAISAAELANHTQPEGQDDELVEVSGLGVPGTTHVSRAWLDSLPGAPFTSHTTTPDATFEPVAEDDAAVALVAAPAGCDGPPGRTRSSEDGAAADAVRAAAASTFAAHTASDSSAAACVDDRARDTGARSLAPARPRLHPGTLGAFLQAVTELAVCDPATGALLGRIDRTSHADHPDPPGRLVRPGSPRRRRRGERKPRVRARGGDTGHGYTPPAWMAALVKARDGGCRFPGCTTAARFCDLDHVTAWPAGPTAAWNLLCLCRRHHRIKQRRGWTVRLAPDGTATWTDPTGRLRTTVPQNLLGDPGTAQVTVVPVEPERVPANHPVAFGIEASDSTLEEELDLAAMLRRHQDAGRRRDQARPRRVGRQPAAVVDDIPPTGCRARLRRDFAHPSTLRTWTLDHWPDQHGVRRGRHWAAADDLPPF